MMSSLRVQGREVSKDAMRCAAIGVFESIAQELTGDQFTVEPVAVADGVALRATVAWDGEGWRIVADAGVDNRRLFWMCWHELYHVLARDVRKVKWPRFERDIQVLTGEIIDPNRLAEFTTFNTGEAAREAAADAFAAHQFSRWWPVVEVAMGYLKDKEV